MNSITEPDTVELRNYGGNLFEKFKTRTWAFVHAPRILDRTSLSSKTVRELEEVLNDRIQDIDELNEEIAALKIEAELGHELHDRVVDFLKAKDSKKNTRNHIDSLLKLVTTGE